MSCHDIGHGLNTVTALVMLLRDQGELSDTTAAKLLKKAKAAVHWCDGNEYEAVESIYGCYCGRCLRKMEPGQKLYDCLDIWDARWREKYPFSGPEIPGGDAVCSDCLDALLLEVSGDPESGPRERKRMEGNGQIVIAEEADLE